MCIERMKNQLIELLNIHSPSGQEEKVVEYLKPILNELLDNVFTDNYGNLLGEKKCGDGNGASILLSSHMDSVPYIDENKVVNDIGDNRGTITATLDGHPTILGADDRAGIAIILEVLRNLENLSFNGTIKVAFSVEEEIGCIGAEKMDSAFYEGADLAIIVDRRGDRDIVVGNSTAFCCNEVGYFMEDVSRLAGMDYKCVEGGVSDAVVFSEYGVNSVNLSAGYYNEHCDGETVIVSHMRDTAKLILQTIAVINDHCHIFTEVPIDNDWVYGGKFSKSIWGESGDVFAYELGGDVVIQQGTNEITMSRSTWRDISDQLKNV